MNTWRCRQSTVQSVAMALVSSAHCCPCDVGRGSLRCDVRPVEMAAPSASSAGRSGGSAWTADGPSMLRVTSTDIARKWLSCMALSNDASKDVTT